MPVALSASDLVLPRYLQRAVVLAKDGGVLIHSVVLRLLLPSRVIISIRILPEGYEIIDVADQPKLDMQTERADDCVVYEDFMKIIKAFKESSVPKSLS